MILGATARHLSHLEGRLGLFHALLELLEGAGVAEPVGGPVGGGAEFLRLYAQGARRRGAPLQLQRPLVGTRALVHFAPQVALFPTKKF